jgi:hypothetical protein
MARPRRRTLLIAISLLVVTGLLAGVFVFGIPWRSSTKSARAQSPPAPSRATTITTEPRDALRADWVTQENAKPGTADWRITKAPKPGEIEGYADAVSAQQGENLSLYVSTTAPVYDVDAFRMGSYQGLWGRRIWRIGGVAGHKQTRTTVTSGLNMIEARWAPSVPVHIDSSWPPGDYLFKLSASTGGQQWIPLTVRDDTSRAAFMVMNAVTDWQAYNTWGGCSLYACPGGGGRTSVPVGTRAKEVSFDRPYREGSGAADFVGNELPLVVLLETFGFDVSYSTSVDLDRRPELVLQHSALLSLGHDEYWSKSMFDGAQSARDRGVNIAFFGANAVYRQIRLVASPLGPARRQINYRSTDDPVRKINPTLTTVSWRESPVNRPEQTLIGQQYECNPVRADLVVADASSWVYSGTGLRNGDHVPITVGTEYDRYDPNVRGPADVEVLAHSPVRCRGKSSYSDVTYYTVPGGGGVFASGTNWWISKLNPPGPGNPHEPAIIGMTLNVLRVFGSGPASRSHPSTANWHKLPGFKLNRGATTSTSAGNT